VNSAVQLAPDTHAQPSKPPSPQKASTGLQDRRCRGAPRVYSKRCNRPTWATCCIISRSTKDAMLPPLGILCSHLMCQSNPRPFGGPISNRGRPVSKRSSMSAVSTREFECRSPNQAGVLNGSPAEQSNRIRSHPPFANVYRSYPLVSRDPPQFSVLTPPSSVVANDGLAAAKQARLPAKSCSTLYSE
jgi:hypothetical protein